METINDSIKRHYGERKLSTIQGKVRNLLDKEPLYRERKMKTRGHLKLLLEQFPELRYLVQSRVVDKGLLQKVLQQHESIDRAWRAILADPENKHLRGTDYNDKHRLETKRKSELGYPKIDRTINDLDEL